MGRFWLGILSPREVDDDRDISSHHCLIGAPVLAIISKRGRAPAVPFGGFGLEINRGLGFKAQILGMLVFVGLGHDHSPPPSSGAVHQDRVRNPRRSSPDRAARFARTA
jgi:hypothetical protein